MRMDRFSRARLLPRTTETFCISRNGSGCEVMGKKLSRKEAEVRKRGKRRRKRKFRLPGWWGGANKPWSGSAAPTLPGRRAASLAKLPCVHVGRQTTLGLVLGIF